MGIIKRVRRLDRNMTIRRRLYISNTFMFLVPIFVIINVTVFSIGAAYYAFKKHVMPNLDVDVSVFEEIGKQNLDALAEFGKIVGTMFLIMLAIGFISIVITNFILTRFLIRRVSEPLEIITKRVNTIMNGNLDGKIEYTRNDEFRPVMETINLMTDRLKYAAERAENEEQSRRELYAGISHDLRSPLTSVRAYTEALLDGVAKTPEDERRYLMKIRNRELDIERMVEQIFLFSKMEMKDFPINMQDINLKDELLKIASENPMEHICVNIDSVKPYVVEADEALFTRIIINLLDNSAKYRNKEVANVIIRTQSGNGYINIFVEDDGPGVSPEILPKLFDAFYRADPARKNPSGGSGLGLAVMKKLVNRMGGNVHARINDKGGLTILFYLREATHE